MSKELLELIVDRCRELNRQAKQIQYDMDKYREVKLTDQERTLLYVKFEKALDEQYNWLNQIEGD